MASPLRLSHQNFFIDCGRKSTPARFERLRVSCYPVSSAGADGPRFSNEESQSRLILLEKYGNGTSKRYIIESGSRIQTILGERLPETSVFQGSAFVEHDSELRWLPTIIKDLILPAGFPDSVSDDYLDYILLQFPTNVTGWICHTLVTSSLLKAIGIGSFSGSAAAAAAATVRWVSKDGIGALGRLFIGGRFGNLFDNDPKQWRLYADFIGSVGSIFDLSTQLYPAYFLSLASVGNLAKAVGRGLRDPSFRVIQNHFAISGNLGEVSAKLLHLWLRYLSLSVLRFNTINLKRARILVNSHVLHRKVPGINGCNKMEDILVWERFMKPRIIFGVSLEEMITGERRGFMLRMLHKLYAEEKYFLVLNQHQTEFEVFVSFKEGATGVSVLRSVWQSYWLHQNWSESDVAFHHLGQSLMELNTRFDDFLLQLEASGWDTSQIILKVPKEILVQEHHTL
ncbi:protein root UVB sensitive 5-like isoform X3 [Primulina eburnea]|uniref:protein root UVB sensitive 5-like isoform X3 n=1 Tax=Primulina eburnea TaxID=1245227 RepID=UPI003C6CBFDA